MSAEPRLRRGSPATTGRVLAIPFTLLLVTMAGLVIGLTGDGARDLLSWGLLLLPLLTLAAAWARRS